MGILPDFFLVDHQLGDGMDGLGFVDALHRLHGRVPLRLLIANRSDAVRAAARPRGVDGLVKPIDAGALLAMVADFGQAPANATKDASRRAHSRPGICPKPSGVRMQLTDSRDILASPDVVWAAIFDPDVLKECVPGCESMIGSVADGFTAVVVARVGPVKATFTGVVTLSDIQAGRSVKISGEGKGGVAGHARGAATVTLAATEAGTKLTYDVDAAVGGKLAQLGSRIIDGFAKKMTDEFFERLQAAVEAPDEAADEGEAVEGAMKKGWFKRLIGV